MTAETETPEVLSGPLGTTVLSRCGLFRYSLTRPCLVSGFSLGVVMHNPSKATHELGDMTVAKVIGFARRLGAASVRIGNLFAFRTKSPKALENAPDPVGPENLEFLRDLVRSTDRILVAWGDLTAKMARKAAPSLKVLRAGGKRLECLGKTRAGAPKHPSRLPYAYGLAALSVWPEGGA